MLRRAQLALSLILLLVVAPLASAACGIQCLGAISQLPIHAAVSQQRCVLASACCHSTGPAVCNAAQAPEATAALLSSNSAPEAPAFAVVAASFSRSSGIGAARPIDSSPPGSPDSASPTPLRI